MGTFPQYQYPHTLARYAEIGRSVGLTGKNDSEVFEKPPETAGTDGYHRDQTYDQRIRRRREYFLETLDEMTEQAFNDQCTGANPRYSIHCLS